jgi:antitoxin MazE
MEVSIIKTGNSKGFRLTKTILEQYKITEKVELILEKRQIILRPISGSRKGWDQAFQKMYEHVDNQLLMDEILYMKTWMNGNKTISNRFGKS